MSKNDVQSIKVKTRRLTMHALEAGPGDGKAVVCIHGNASSSEFWRGTLEALPPGYRGLAFDLRGYGDTEDKLIDATRGPAEWVDDILAALDELQIDTFHATGHSLGGMVLYTLAHAAGSRLLSATLVAPGSPYGFGGTKDANGTPCWPDYAGSGGGLVNPDFARLMGEKNRGSDNPQASPRNVMNNYYWKPPFKPAEEEALLTSLLSEKVGPDKYPGDSVPSANWPGVGPGIYGPLNAASPKYIGDSVKQFLATKVPVLWIRGADDQIVSDFSLFDMGTLGKLGAVPGWPGEEVFPPQPMVTQTRTVLEERKIATGAHYKEIVFNECGHSPLIEKAEEFRSEFFAFLKSPS